MMTTPPHNRKLGIVGVSLTKAKLNPHALKALGSVREEIEPVLVRSGYLRETPFSWVTVSLRFGLKNEDEPHYEKISKKYGDLPLAIEINTHELTGASEAELRRLFKIAVLRALLAAGQQYRCPVEELKLLLSDETRSQ